MDLVGEQEKNFLPATAVRHQDPSGVTTKEEYILISVWILRNEGVNKK